MSALERWQGDFGDSYHDRNRFSPEEVKPVFDRILDGLELYSVLEVGCGLGHNLAAISAVRKTGVEPNEQALAEARHAYPEIAFLAGDVRALPFFADTFDLVLTSGLLIHIHPDDIREAVSEIARVTRRYVCLIEYGAAEEEEVPYRGERDILWRRPFGKLFQAWEGFTLLATDDSDSLLYPGCSWWLLESRR